MLTDQTSRFANGELWRDSNGVNKLIFAETSSPSVVATVKVKNAEEAGDAEGRE